MKVNHKIILFSLIGGVILSSAAASYWLVNNNRNEVSKDNEEGEDNNELSLKEENSSNLIFNIRKKAAGDNTSSYELTVTYKELLSGNDKNFTATPAWVEDSDKDVGDYIKAECAASYDETSGFCSGCKVTITCLKAFSTQIRLSIASSSASGSVILDYVAKITSFTVGGARLSDSILTSSDKDESGNYLPYIDLSYTLSDSTISGTVSYTSCKIVFSDAFFNDISTYLYGKEDNDIINACKGYYNQDLSVYNGDADKRHLESTSCGVSNASSNLYLDYGETKNTSRNGFALALIDALGKCNSNQWAKIAVDYTFTVNNETKSYTASGDLTIDEDALNNAKTKYKNTLIMSSGSENICF